MEPLFICFTMDVERIRAQSPGGGPESWDVSERSIRSYSNLLNEQQYPVTYFLVPEAAEYHAELFRALQQRKNECGMHFHVESWRENYCNPSQFKALGGYPGVQQHEMLGAARDQVQVALGIKPTAFRGGYFSANNATYTVLTDLGFTCGSTSLPGRRLPQRNAYWIGKRRDVHAVDAENRLRAGDLPFVDVPLSVRLWLFGHLHPHGDTRFERARNIPDLQAAVRQSLAWQRDHQSPVKHLCFFTHNVYFYDEDLSPPLNNRRKILHSFLSAIPSLATEFSLVPQGCTLSQIRDVYWQAQTAKIKVP